MSRNVEIAQAAAQVKQLHAEMLSWQEKLEELEETEGKQKEQLQQLAAELRQQQLKADRLKLNLEQVQQQKTRDNERLLLLWMIAAISLRPIWQTVIRLRSCARQLPSAKDRIPRPRSCWIT